jgi:predicted dehydrogenase
VDNPTAAAENASIYTPRESSMNHTSRRDFLRASAVAGSAVAWSQVANVHAQGSDVIKVGLVGCGGRGSGAIEQNLRADNNCKLVAVGDTFRDRAEGTLRSLTNNQAVAQKVDVPAERIFIGLDAYQRVIEQVDLVILATPPGFRATHLQAAVRARKNIFTEKPVCVDGPGARMCLEAYEQANRNHLTIVAGTQRRYQTEYTESMKRIHEGALGTITSARVFWNQGRLWNRTRTEGMTDVEWQLRNWLYFTWLSGDHITEQHVHNLDVANWALGNSHPVKAMGMGGRQVRTAPEFGHIFDHFAVDYEYPNGAHVMSMCRQIEGCANSVSEHIVGTRGKWTSGGYRITGDTNWNFPRQMTPNPYQQEHVELYRAIRGARPAINDLKNVTESSLTAVMGRMSCYTGKEVTWEQALNSQQNLMPSNLTWDMRLPVPAVAVPGRTELT